VRVAPHSFCDVGITPDGNGKLKDEKEALEKRNDKMLKMLHQLKEQLRKVSEIAEKRGCGDLVNSILEEASVTQTLESPEFTCFDRLYEDAKRRMEKQRIWEEERMGLRPRSPNTRVFFHGLPAAGGGVSQPSLGGAMQSSSLDAPQRSYSAPGDWNGVQGSNSWSLGMVSSMGGYAVPANNGARTTPNIQSNMPVGMQFHEGQSPFFLGASPPGSPDAMPIPVGSSPIAKARAFAQGPVNEWGDWMSEGMGIVGEGYQIGRPSSGLSGISTAPGESRPFSRISGMSSPDGSRPGSRMLLGTPSGDMMRATTPAEIGRRPRTLLGMGASRSTGALSAMDMDIQGTGNGVPQSERLAMTLPCKKFSESKSASTGRLEEMMVSTPLAERREVLANSMWSGMHGEYLERPSGPGMLRGFKLVGNRQQRKLLPFQGAHPKLSGSLSDELFNPHICRTPGGSPSISGSLRPGSGVFTDSCDC